MSSTPRADLWFSLVLTLFGVAAMVESWRMPRLAELGINPLSAPGLTPGLLALVLTGLGVALLVRSLRAVRAGAVAAPRAEGSWGRLALALVLCLLYALVLVGTLPFMVATGLFVFAFTVLFSWTGRRPAATIAGAALLAVAVAVAVTLLFERVFLVRLP